jgi:hypothetical protein
LPEAGQARSPNGRLGEESYPELNLQMNGEDPFNGIGLYVLSRNLVTLDFPKRTMYLKRTSGGPLHSDINEVKAEAKSAAVFLKSLKKKGHLPGWAKDDETVAEKAKYIPRSTVSGCFVVQKKNGDSSVYHFQVSRASENQPWKLQKAWRTDQNDKTIEEFPVP